MGHSSYLVGGPHRSKYYKKNKDLKNNQKLITPPSNMNMCDGFTQNDREG